MLFKSFSITLTNKLSFISHDFKDLKDEPKFHINEPLLRIIFNAIDKRRDIIFMYFKLSPSSKIDFIDFVWFFSFSNLNDVIIDENVSMILFPKFVPLL